MADLDPAVASAPPEALSPAAALAPPVAAAPAGSPTPVAPSSVESELPLGAEGIRARLVTLAQAESQSAKKAAALQHDFSLRAELLQTAVPDKYLELVSGMRAAVRAFNDSLAEVPSQRLTHLGWYESPNVALRDAITGDGMRVRVSRNNSYFDLVMRMVGRTGKADIPIIEGLGSMGRELIRTETLMRIEGWVENGAVRFIVSLDFKRMAIPLDEIPDRIVMAVASHDYSVIGRKYGGQIVPRRAPGVEVPEDT